MSSLPHHWFVQTDFGALLGPMPHDALAEMARTGALLVHDQVREGIDGEWRHASEVPGLFDEQTESLGLLSSTLEDLFVPETCAPQKSAVSRNTNRRSSAKLEENPPASELYEREFETDIPLIVPTAIATSSPVVESVRVQEPNSSPTTKIPTRFESELVNDLVPLADPPNIREPEPVLPTPSGWKVRVTPDPPNIREPEPVLPAPSGWKARVTKAPRWQSMATRLLRRWQSDKQARLKGAIAVVVLVVLVGAWSFWPRRRPDIYKSYVAIYQELQQRRDTTENYAAWTEFVTRAKTQLAETVPWLEQKAKPGDREKSLLLYAGRDLQELLELPRTSTSPHQKRLNAFFEQLQEMYGSN